MATSNHTEFYPAFIRLLAECEAVLSAPECDEECLLSARDALALIDPAVSKSDGTEGFPEYAVSRIPVQIQGEARQEVIGLAVAMYGRLREGWNSWADAREEADVALMAVAEKAFPAQGIH